jgi:predicted Rossmann fold flavoprotein
MSDKKYDIIVIGGGAAGFFAALNALEMHPWLRVLLLEKSNKVLAKVKISGGGRCNVTHACFEPDELIKNYPRGGRQLRTAFHEFSTNDTIRWFAAKGVDLKKEADGRMFPVTDNSQTIIDCFMQEAQRLNLEIKLGVHVSSLEQSEAEWLVHVEGGGHFTTNKIVIATGGSPKPEGLHWLKQMGHKISNPVPSLFTFNVPNHPITEMMGLSVSNATVKIEGTKFSYSGPLLITHWGFSGPAVLKSSSFAACELAALHYKFNILVNWCGNSNQEAVKEQFLALMMKEGNRKLFNCQFNHFPSRLWKYLLTKAEVHEETKAFDLRDKKINKIVQILTNDLYSVNGKTTFKEEFVTAGGIHLDSLNMKTMESKVCPGLYFAGEVLDVDGITGGFNFQAAWSTGYLAAKSIVKSLNPKN